MFLGQAVIDLGLLEWPWTQSRLDRLVMVFNKPSGCSQPLLKIMRVQQSGFKHCLRCHRRVPRVFHSREQMQPKAEAPRCGLGCINHTKKSDFGLTLTGVSRWAFRDIEGEEKSRLPFWWFLKHSSIFCATLWTLYSMAWMICVWSHS